MHTFSETEIGDLLLTLYNGGLWESLSPEMQTKCEGFLQSCMDNKIELSPPKRISPRLTLNETIEMVKTGLNLSSAQSDFWILVVKICYFIQSLELDPLLTKKIKDSTAIQDYVSSMFK